MRVCGTNGSQCWDLAFLIQAILSTPLAADPSNRDTLERALGWLDRNQTRESVRGKEGVGNEWREETKGAWGFSTITQGYTLSDCTGEALKVVVRLQREFGYVAHFHSPFNMLTNMGIDSRRSSKKRG